jgi:FkbM family methyltransferase
MIFVDGWFRPEEDTLGFAAIRKDAERHLVGMIQRWCLDRLQTAVCAGGHVGIYPVAVGRVFRQVLTFEPSRSNFDCLIRNIKPFAHIVPYHLALGQETTWATALLLPEDNNGGTYRISPTGDLPCRMLRLDDLHLQNCDLIQLDVEGYELHALMGARETLARCRPVLFLEVKDHLEKHGHNVGQLHHFLKDHGYRMMERVKDDEVWTPGK